VKLSNNSNIQKYGNSKNPKNKFEFFLEFLPEIPTGPLVPVGATNRDYRVLQPSAHDPGHVDDL
jgi:hypothetical protein